MIPSHDHKYEPDKETKKLYQKFAGWFKLRLLDSISEVLMADYPDDKPDSAIRKAADLIVDYKIPSSFEAFKAVTEEAVFCWYIRCICWEYMRRRGYTDLSLLDTCHKYHPYMDIFQAEGDYTEDLFEIDDEVIERLSELPLDNIFHIGWLYQYYNQDIRDEYYEAHKSHNKKATTVKDVIAISCIYTPYWVVREMLENSLGRVWIQHHLGAIEGKDQRTLADRFGWSYFLENAEQTPEVTKELEDMHKDFKDKKPQDIEFLEPCMGTGLILLSAFDILVQIYEDDGIEPKDAIRPILERNLHGVDIDNQAWRVAKFSLLMRAAEIDPSILTEKIDMHHYACPLINGRDVDLNKLMWFGTELKPQEKIKAYTMFQLLCKDFEIVKKTGSLNIPATGLDVDLMRRYINSPEDISGLEALQFQMNGYLDLVEILTKKYDTVTTNPPYMGAKHFDADLKYFVNDKTFIEIPEELDPWEDVYFPYLAGEFNSALANNLGIKPKKKKKKKGKKK